MFEKKGRYFLSRFSNLAMITLVAGILLLVGGAFYLTAVFGSVNDEDPKREFETTQSPADTMLQRKLESSDTITSLQDPTVDTAP